MDSESYEGDSRTRECVEEMDQDIDKIGSLFLDKCEQYDEKIADLESQNTKLEKQILEQDDMLTEQKEIIHRFNSKLFFLSLALKKLSKEIIKEDLTKLDKIDESDSFDINIRPESPLHLECSEEFSTKRSSPAKSKIPELTEVNTEEFCEEIIESSINSSQTDLNDSSESTQTPSKMPKSGSTFIKLNVIGTLVMIISVLVLSFLVSKYNEVI